MADNKPPTGGDLFDLIINGSSGHKAIEEAIQKGLQSYVETATAEISKLVKANTVGPDAAAEMLKLNKTVIDQTIAFIKDGPLAPPGSKSD